MRARDLLSAVNELVNRVRDAQAKFRDATGAAVETSRRLDAIAKQLLTEPVRYGQPGLQEHIRYLAGMTTGADQKVGRDAIERYATLKKEFDAVKAEVDRLLGISITR